MSQTCAVVGCGPAGIAATLALRSCGLMPTCFELADKPGGMWNNGGHDAKSSRGVLSPISHTMRCALPKDLISFSSFCFPFTAPHFPHHSVVKEYLRRYCEARGISSLTRFNTSVQSARWSSEEKCWKLLSVNHVNGAIYEWSFERLVVATGQYHSPHVEGVPSAGLESFQEAKGVVLHATEAKNARLFKGKKVVVVGDGVSAYNCLGELHRAGAHVVHSSLHGTAEEDESSPASSPMDHRANKMMKKWIAFRLRSSGISTMVGKLSHFEGRTVVCHKLPPRLLGVARIVDEARGRTLSGSSDTVVNDVDAVVCATGYKLAFPFLSEEIRRRVEDPPLQLEATRETDSNGSVEDSIKRARLSFQGDRGLFLGTIFAENPSLAFIGLQRDLLPPFTMFEAQAQFVASAFSHRYRLPATADAMRQREAEIVSASTSLQSLYSTEGMGLRSGVYYNALLREVGLPANYAANILSRKWWFMGTATLQLVHKFRSWAPLLRKQQHVLFSNKI